MPPVTQLVGRHFEQVYDTGVTYAIAFQCERTLRWEITTGPHAGRSAIALYDSVVIAPGIYFITWAEEDGTVVSQVADYNRMIIYTSLSCDGNLILLKGTVR